MVQEVLCDGGGTVKAAVEPEFPRKYAGTIMKEAISVDIGGNGVQRGSWAGSA